MFEPKNQLNPRTLDSLSEISRNNAHLLIEARQARCYACQYTFEASDVEEFETSNLNKGSGMSACCPICGEQCVIPDTSDIVLTDNLFFEVAYEWHCNGVKTEHRKAG